MPIAQRLAVLFSISAWLIASHALAETCSPTCGEGEACVAGVCVASCDPPCADDEACRDGACRRVATLEAAPGPAAAKRWFVTAGAGHAIGEVYTAPNRNVDASVPQLRLGVGLRHALRGLLSLRGEVTVIGGSDFRDSSIFGAQLSTSLRIGPVAESFPWLFGFGPMVGFMVLRGQYPNEADQRGRGTGALVGVMAETGFAFDDIEVTAEFRGALWPSSESSGFIYGGLCMALAI